MEVSSLRTADFLHSLGLLVEERKSLLQATTISANIAQRNAQCLSTLSSPNTVRLKPPRAAGYESRLTETSY
jgi:hypothetical protein